MLQGIAAQIAELASAVEADAGAALTRLRVDGGLTQSSVLLQVIADILQLPVDVYPRRTPPPWAPPPGPVEPRTGPRLWPPSSTRGSRPPRSSRAGVASGPTNSVAVGGNWRPPPTDTRIRGERRIRRRRHRAGIVGSAIARELAGHRLTVALIDSRTDVGDGTSKANTAILHTGFDAKPGTLEADLVRRGYRLLSEYAVGTGIPIERTGAILVAWDAEQLDALPGLRDKAEDNAYGRCEIIDATTVYDRLPHLGPGALGGLTVPDESITCTWTVNLALATDAVNRGAHLRLGCRVESVEVEAGRTTLHTGDGPIRTRWVVNAAGLGADVVDGHFGFDRFRVTPGAGN